MRICYLIFLSIFVFLSCPSKPASTEVRKSALAGKWYSSDPRKLASTIDRLLEKSKKTALPGNPLVFILPHAGYPYSGKVAATGYNIIRKINPDIIVIIGPSHHSRFQGCSILPVDFYETPLGKVKVEKKIAQKLLSGRLFKTDEYAHRHEHSIEIHLPFLQRLYKDSLKDRIGILPILVGDIDKKDAKRISRAIIKAITGKNSPLFIISSDFTHYGRRFGYLPFRSRSAGTISKKLSDLDHGAIDLILKKDLNGFSDYVNRTGITICGRNPIKIALAVPVKDFSAGEISYDTSGNITGDYQNSVSYSAIAFSGTLKRKTVTKETEFRLSDDDKKFLLHIARKNIGTFLLKNTRLDIDINRVPENCRLKRGAFVTLKIHDRLRGCIGYVEGIKPLYQTVLDNSYNAAFRDPRFGPLKQNELKSVKIEISVLTKPGLIGTINEIKVGRDGLIIERGRFKGLLLPQVAPEWGWDRNEFLIHTCRKAGLPDNAWKDKETRIYRFQAIVFNED